MLTIVPSNRFMEELKQLKRQGKDLEELLAAVDLLAEDGNLPDSYSPHQLTAEWSGVWECHIEPDWLLIYRVTGREVVLLRTGTHKELFG